MAKAVTPPGFETPKRAKARTPVPKVIAMLVFMTPNLSAKRVGSILPGNDAAFWIVS